MPSILVINPNSNERVTENLRESLEIFQGRANIECCTLSSGPFGIESDDDIRAVVPLIIDRIAADHESDAFVIACYSDPGLVQCREQFDSPIFGMQESAIRAAARDDRPFGVLALSDESIARHLPYVDSLGYAEQLVAELPLGISVDQSANDPGTLSKVVDCGRRLIDDFGAQAIVLGCAGMAALREPAEQALAVPVIEPAQAAVRIAIEAAG
ncbi:MAG: aspartate/glutamate racemase family protein [Gammaproteobacteria bacterium]|nr:aspartate/glutamate racemase family protein [Gammaproteobacteria bacterium]